MFSFLAHSLTAACEDRVRTLWRFGAKSGHSNKRCLRLCLTPF